MTDLFPETLLVAHTGGRIYTTSLKVAEHFHKRHSHVLRDIEKLLADLAEIGDRQPKFGLTIRTVSGPKGAVRQGKIYEVSEEGFALLAMGFTGRQALRWKLDFLNAFREMERQLAAQQARYVAALDAVRPCLRPVAEDAAAGLPRRYTAWSLGKSVASVSYHRAQARQLGVLKPAGRC